MQVNKIYSSNGDKCYLMEIQDLSNIPKKESISVFEFNYLCVCVTTRDGTIIPQILLDMHDYIL